MSRAFFAVLLATWAGLAAASDGDAYSIATFTAGHPAQGTVTVVAFITEIYRCPPCPRGAQCKPCVGDHAVLCDEPAPQGGAPTVRVFAERDALAALEPGRRYRLRLDLAKTVRLQAAEPVP